LKLVFEQALESLAVAFLVAVVAVEELEQVEEDELEARNKKDRDFDY
jgi:hypothetical protein